MHLTQAGPDLIKKFAYLDAEIARHWDVQIAALYFDQMMRKGKHHKVVHGHRHKQNRAGLGLPDGRGLLLRILLCLIARQRCVREVSTEVVAI